MMKKLLCCALCALLSLSLTGALAEDVTLYGTLQFNETVSVTAPYSGCVGDYTIKVGDHVASGDTLMRLNTTKVYAPISGTVESVFLAPGDDAATAQARYGRLMSIAPLNNLTLSATVRTGSSNTTRDVTVGQMVYARSTANTSRTGTAVITAVNASGFEADVVDGTLRALDNVNIFQTASLRDNERIGAGSVARVAGVSVTGDGTVLALHVKAGDTVSRGDLLMELLPGAFNGEHELTADIKAPVAGTVVSIAAIPAQSILQDALVLTLAPDDALVAVLTLDEMDLPNVRVGDTLRMTLDLDEKAYAYQATVQSIGQTNVGTVAAPAYNAYLTFQNDAFVREGMRVTATR